MAGREPLLNSHNFLLVCVLNILMIVPFVDAVANNIPFFDKAIFSMEASWQLTIDIERDLIASRSITLPLWNNKWSEMDNSG